MAAAYAAAWRELLELALAELSITKDPLVLQSALATVALAKGDLRLGAFLIDTDKSERDAVLEDSLNWATEYRDNLPPPAALDQTPGHD
jgi:hypothetical protein